MELSFVEFVKIENNDFLSLGSKIMHIKFKVKGNDQMLYISCVKYSEYDFFTPLGIYHATPYNHCTFCGDISESSMCWKFPYRLEEVYTHISQRKEVRLHLVTH